MPFLLEAREKDLSGLKSTCCFFPKKLGRGRRTWGRSPTHGAPLAVFLTSRDNTTMRENLATFEEEIRQNLPGTRPFQYSKDLSLGEVGACPSRPACFQGSFPGLDPGSAE